MELIGFFDNGAAAMSDRAGDAIPADHVLGGLGHGAMMPFVDTHHEGSSSSLRLFRQTIGPRNVVGSQSDTLRIQLKPIDDIGLPAAEYRGVLHLRLFAY